MGMGQQPRPLFSKRRTGRTHLHPPTNTHPKHTHQHQTMAGIRRKRSHPPTRHQRTPILLGQQLPRTKRARTPSYYRRTSKHQKLPRHIHLHIRNQGHPTLLRYRHRRHHLDMGIPRQLLPQPLHRPMRGLGFRKSSPPQRGTTRTNQRRRQSRCRGRHERQHLDMGLILRRATRQKPKTQTNQNRHPTRHKIRESHRPHRFMLHRHRHEKTNLEMGQLLRDTPNETRRRHCVNRVNINRAATRMETLPTRRNRYKRRLFLRCRHPKQPLGMEPQKKLPPKRPWAAWARQKYSKSGNPRANPQPRNPLNTHSKNRPPPKKQTGRGRLQILLHHMGDKPPTSRTHSHRPQITQHRLSIKPPIRHKTQTTTR